MGTTLKLISLFTLVIWVTSCGAGTKKIEVSGQKQPRYFKYLIGKIVSHEKETGIILFRKFGNVNFEDGNAFITEGEDGRVGNIKLTGQGNQLYLAAELQDGKVVEGDIVFRQTLNPHYQEDKDKELEVIKPKELTEKVGENNIKVTPSAPNQLPKLPSEDLPEIKEENKKQKEEELLEIPSLF